MRAILLISLILTVFSSAAPIPLPEHPRPDFERAHWLNLNGDWAFEFDAENVGVAENWQSPQELFSKTITVPFPWGSELSGLEDKAVIGWYQRKLQIPAEWQGERIFIIVGAADWHTTAWLDGQKLGEHRGGYTPFEFEITDGVKWGEPQTLVFRVDDTEHDFKLYGKQGYGDARGIWQTVYAEARPQVYIETLHFTPDIDRDEVTVDVKLSGDAPRNTTFKLKTQTGEPQVFEEPIKRGRARASFTLKIDKPRLWSLDDPFLYEVTAELTAADQTDAVASYFGMREISIEPMPDTRFPYVALNGEPVYLQLALDQGYHREGYYTYPSDDFMRNDILRTRRLGLNGQRIHVKIDPPRKLYWADKLGVLIMADVPNSWGEPDSAMRAETEYALRHMIKRDYNHPSIFSWVIFNETWGLQSENPEGEGRVYLPETQKWVVDMYELAKKLDATRLVEDNSANRKDHTVTDLNSWHAYLPGYGWADYLGNVVENTYPGSQWNFAEGYTQTEVPMLNSEFGNVWGYKGSTGDVDWSYDYHRAMNEFRRHPKISGWLYTEHHDVINEWNGYYKFDRSEKITGLDELVPGMRINDWHAPFYISVGQEICRDAKVGEEVELPLYASFMTGDCSSENLTLKLNAYGWDEWGRKAEYGSQSLTVPFAPWLHKQLSPATLEMPATPGLVILAMVLEDESGTVLHRNVAAFRVRGNMPVETGLTALAAPPAAATGEWSQKKWAVLDGLKMNGAGAGYFELVLDWPDGIQASELSGAVFKAELGAKQLFGKDRGAEVGGDYMRGAGSHDPSANPNAYPMTDNERYPSQVQVLVNGVAAGIADLPDDPADHRGWLSWHSQNKDRTLHEAGSYGYLVEMQIPQAALQRAEQDGQLKIRLTVDDSLPGGLAIYGKDFGRYPLDPTVVLIQ